MTIVTLLSDFGTRDTYAGVVEGAILRVAPDARVLHLTHGIPPGDVALGARALARERLRSDRVHGDRGARAGAGG